MAEAFQNQVNLVVDIVRSDSRISNYTYVLNPFNLHKIKELKDALNFIKRDICRYEELSNFPKL